MKPSLPHHSTTTLHRTPGGLRTLDLFVERISNFADQNSDHEIKILVVGDEHGNFSLPIATLGYDVTSLYVSETFEKKTNQLCAELGINIQTKTTKLTEEISGKYDIILLPNLPDSSAEITDLLTNMLDKTKAHGIIIFGAKASTKFNFPALLAIIKATKSRIFSTQSSGFIFPKIFSKYPDRIKKSSSFFHFLDNLDSLLSNLIPRRMATSWIFECRKKHAKNLVAYILPTLSAGGGAERLVMQLAARMPDSDYEAHIITNVRGGGLEDSLRKQNIPFTVLNRQGIFGRFKNITRLKNLLKDLQPDIVHTNLFAADLWGRISAHMAGCKNVVTTIHNVQNYYGKLGVFFMRILKSYSKIYIAISKDVAGYIKETLHVSSSKIKTIPNGVETTKIVKRQNRPFHDVPKLLFIGRLEPQKNPDIFLRAIAEVRGRFECSIYGEGSMENELKHLADELGILPRIYWNGVVENTNDVYAKHDIFILPSAWEGFGLVAVEAAVAGIPMVVTDLPVMRELFKEKVKMAKPGSVEDLTEAIEDILDRPAESINKAQQLSSQDFSMYSIDKMTADHVDLYNSLVKSQS
jgi:glycosyltransferase involved in cell wall biosynthesis